MIDIKFLRENPEIVKQNIRNKFQDHKLPLVDEVIALDEELRAAIKEANDLRASRNSLSKQIGMLMGQAKKDPSKLAEAEAVKELDLKKAAELLKSKKYNVQEAAEAVGYNDIPTFRKHFVDLYGITPSAFSKEESNEKNRL